MNKNPPFINGHYYHIYNRGVEKRNVSLNRKDYPRFEETLDFYRKAPQPIKLSDFRRNKLIKKIVKNQKEIIKILCYSLMPNHFHLLIQQLEDGGVTKFLKNITNSYTRFFNTKYERIGPLFQGSFKAKLIDTDEYLLQISKYIHRNSFSLKLWEGMIYPYSSYMYYLTKEKHPFCDTNIILSYFSQNNPSVDYKNFVEEKDIDDPSVYNLLIDPED